MTDKIRKLAIDLYCEPDEQWSSPDPIEEKIRAELKPLLDAGYRAMELLVRIRERGVSSVSYCEADEVIAKLEGWKGKP